MRAGIQIKTLLLTLILTMSAALSYAQYYSWGADPAHLRWEISKSNHTKVIYPTESEQIGRTTL